MFQLQNDISATTQQIKDLFDLASLNLAAVDLVTKKKFQDKIRSVISLYQQFQSLKLQQFIKKQIYLEGDFERTDRMKDYEDKIQIQRRLVTDKQTNYLGLFKKKTLMSLSYTPEDYALVQMNKKKIERQNHIEYYKNDLVTYSQIKITMQQKGKRMEAELERLNEEKNKLQKIMQRAKWVADKPEQYVNQSQQNFVQSQLLQNMINNPELNVSNRSIRYLNKLSTLKSTNLNLKNKLDAKSSFTQILLKQNEQLKAKLSKKLATKSVEEKDKTC